MRDRDTPEDSRSTSPASEVERCFTVNIFTALSDVTEAHRLAEQILKRIEDLPAVLTGATTVNLEEPVRLHLIGRINKS